MNNYKKINIIFGWAVFLIAATVYIITSEPTMSFWDCGEYISTAFKLEVGHPPGAPLFQFIGRFFTLFAFGDVTHVARMVNTMSALSSAFTILFLFWSITLIGKKIITSQGHEINQESTFRIMVAGLVGSLAYTFTDSFWFSAVEGEVYAMSSFFTAVVFWAILKWEEQSDKPYSLRYLILIAYLIGLSVGVHLLNLLAIPAITFVYYFKKFPRYNRKGILLTLVISILILATVMFVIIPWVIRLAGWFERLFVNDLGFPFNSGTIFYFIVLIGGIIWGLHVTRRRNKPILNAIILSITFIIIGYTSFLMLVIRSNANTPIDENNPENAMYLLSYLNREQYGDWPLFSGPYYNAPVIEKKDGNPTYTKDLKSGQYIITDKKEKTVPIYDPRFTTIFPRMWSNYEQKYINEYIRWGKVQGVPITVTSGEQSETLYRPTFSENLRFFWNYQLIHMYYRYFMWNFAGRQNDAQGLGNKIEGNWKSGISFIDQTRLGKPPLPEIRRSKADNSFYFLPLLLGLVGIWYTFRKDYRSGIVTGLLFFMTGLAIVIYLNQYAPQPRERDYAFAGSFYAFAFWIGLGMLQIIEWLRKITRPRIATLIAGTLGMIVVLIMAVQGWNDHDRSGRYTALSTAKNYLNSCAPNAILFTNGDNDTFPLWYAQEVEGIRTDVRVVNLSLLNTDWYINQLRRKAYDGEPIPVTLAPELYRQGNHDVTYFLEDEKYKGYFDLRDVFSVIKTDDTRWKMSAPEYGTIDFLPMRKFIIPCDSRSIVKDKLVPANYYSKLDTIRFTVSKQALEKNDLIVLDIIAHNNWKRPVYFAMTMGADSYLGLDNYLYLEGLTYRLLPVKVDSANELTGSVNVADMYDHVMNKFEWGNMQNPHVYLDDQNQKMAMNFRNVFSRLADGLIREGKMAEAVKVLDRCEEVMPDNIVPYNYFSVPIAEGYYIVGETTKANKIAERLYKYMAEDLAYLFSFSKPDYAAMDVSFQEDLMTLQRLGQAAQENKQDVLGKKIEDTFRKYYQMYADNVYQPR